MGRLSATFRSKLRQRPCHRNNDMCRSFNRHLFRPPARLVSLAILVMLPLAVYAQPVAPSALPAWLQKQVAKYEASPLNSQPSRVWQFEYRGKTVYYIPAPCCDQFDSLYDADGTYLCAPSGGYLGSGDQHCPDALPESKKRKRVWIDPRIVIR